MLNKEKYAAQILELACGGSGIAMDKDTMKLCPCEDIACEYCYFNSSNYPDSKPCLCQVNLKHWANSSGYVKPKQFTEQEKAVLKALDKIKWVARDEDGGLFGYVEKPQKKNHAWRYESNCICLSDCSSCEFNSINWEDAEPTSRAEILGGSEI